MDQTFAMYMDFSDFSCIYLLLAYVAEVEYILQMHGVN